MIELVGYYITRLEFLYMLTLVLLLTIFLVKRKLPENADGLDEDELHTPSDVGLQTPKGTGGKTLPPVGGDTDDLK